MHPFHRVLLAIVLVILTCFAVLVVAYVGENRRGAAEWAAAQRELRAKGETLLWSDFVPPPVRASENLAFAPFYARVLAYAPDPKTGFYTFGDYNARLAAAETTPFSFPRSPGIPSLAREPLARTDLAAYAKVFRALPGFPRADQTADPATQVLTALTRLAPALDELARAAERPLTRFPVNWRSRNPFQLNFAHESVQQQLTTTLALRASARLAAGQSTDALRDLQLAFRLCRDMGTEPTLISLLMQATSLRTLFVPVWEGLADRRWSAVELSVLQVELGRFDLLAGYRLAVRGERACFDVQGIDYLATHLGEWPALQSFGMPVSAAKRNFFQLAGTLSPRGWFDANRATSVRFMQTYYVEGIDPAAHRIFPAKFKAVPSAVAALPSGPTTFFVKNEFSGLYSTMALRAARAQVNLDAALVSCALERFRLDHSTYPATLSHLAPTYIDRLPADLVDGSPLRYAQTADGRYRLYEVGWNDHDDSGAVAWQKSGASLDETAGDWVWQYEPLQLPSAARPGK